MIILVSVLAALLVICVVVTLLVVAEPLGSNLNLPPEITFLLTLILVVLFLDLGATFTLLFLFAKGII